MRTCTWILAAITVAVVLLPMAAAHGGHGHPEDEDQNVLEDCRNTPSCRTVTGLVGYDWFGTGLWGMALGVAFWTLVAFGSVKLVLERLNTA